MKLAYLNPARQDRLAQHSVLDVRAPPQAGAGRECADAVQQARRACKGKMAGVHTWTQLARTASLSTASLLPELLRSLGLDARALTQCSRLRLLAEPRLPGAFLAAASWRPSS